MLFQEFISWIVVKCKIYTQGRQEGHIQTHVEWKIKSNGKEINLNQPHTIVYLKNIPLVQFQMIILF